MTRGTELFMGAKRHDGLGFSIHVGIGGVFIELVKDIASTLAPVSFEEAMELLTKLKAQKLFEGYRNLPPVNKEAFARQVVIFSNIFKKYPDIIEIDINPLIASGENILSVDARIITDETNKN
jgi:acetyltransferase